MSEGAFSNPGSLPISLQKRVDEACDRFEKAWKDGLGPRIEEYLAEVPEPDRAALLRSLLGLEIELRCKKGDEPAIHDYEGRFAVHAELIRAVFAESPSLDDEKGGAGERTTVPIPCADSPKGEETRQIPVQGPPVLYAIGRYKVCKKLGGGAYGNVYLARDDLMDRDVAIKVPSSKLLAAQSAKEQFLSEARSVARLQHEGIVRAYDFGQETDGRCYIVYEFIDGETLADRIKPNRLTTEPLLPDTAAKIVVQLAEALNYAHLQGLVHRDIKPANIMLDRRGNSRVTDFGLAVREEDLPNERGRLAGTLPYMSPEQVRRQSHLDGRTDIYSLGVVLYELLCGRRPFAANMEGELKDQILHREAKPPRQIKDSIPPELERICLKALSKRVQDRYTTAKDMAKDVLQAIESNKNSKSEQDAAITLQEVERRMASADEHELRRLLRILQEACDPACVPLVFRCLSHSSEAVRQQARKVVHSLGWNKVSDAAEDIARRDDATAIGSVLDGLAAFEAHPQIVGLLDRLVVLLKGELRNRTILLLERKRLGLELDAVAALFRDIHSPYRIEKALGQGLFSAAYLAHADGTDLAVVVRVLRPEVVSQPDLRAQFLDLSKRALQLVHENLVLTREARAFPERNIYFAVRDYVNGVTLQKLLEGGKRFEPPQIVRILRQLLAALGAVHRRGMCHGGIKPSNIFVCNEDQVVLGDPALPVQGIGVALERLSYDYRYAAPETFRGGGTVMPQADFYALGCVAYEMACGKPPFVSDNYLELATRHLHDAIAPPSNLGSGLGPAGDATLLKLLARSYTDRYTSAVEVLQALDWLESSWRSGQETASWLTNDPRLTLSGRPLLRDASLEHLRGAESVLGFDASAASLMPRADESLPLFKVLSPEQGEGEQPNRIGEYDILKPLGRGGMGVVYLGRDRRLNRLVALKVLHSVVADLGAKPDNQRNRFLREAQAVARLQHPNIVQIYDVGEHQRLSYLALEYVEGGTLAHRLRTDKPAPRAAAELVAKVARAVHHAHEAGILHRDLKPANILLTPDGQPKIADFGLAKIQELPDDDAAATLAGTIMGTPAYMAPEQAAGKVHALGPAADVYGLGAILYELLVGRPPFRGATVMETLSQLATQEVIPPHKLNSAVNRELSVICLKCLEKEPKGRYASAKGLAEDLERWLEDRPIQARSATSIGRLVRRCQKVLADLFLFRNRG